MKCEKCNVNEANVYYRTSVNGHTTEQHLCTHCAGEQGLDVVCNWPGRELLEESFTGFFGRDPFENFFSGGLLPGFGRGRTTGGTMLRPTPRVAAAEPEAPAGTKAEPDPELDRRRRCNALKAQLEAAVKAEDYEKAIELRDELRKLEK